ncbi:hypothetical protein BET01_12770 [Lacrimispora algidixylanolytica]|uniref:Peptidase M16 N-terminal domain-containing protein n=1 Tax=Lacrimispora algidixylanolytica TaxID=94868 RepID=A0A419T978_9FIRM|nr:hypothetical protein BET01_12770 [Lacrimispora algidixylanolytica]
MKEINSFYTKGERRYFFYNMEEAEEQAVAVLLIERGSMSENHDEKGLSHFLEHISLGFDKFNPDQRIKCSGFTDFYYTYFMFVIEVQLLEECLDRIEKIISGKYFEKNTFDDIKKDVIKEYEDTINCIQTKEFARLLEDTEYMEHLAIGDLEVIQTCGFYKLQDFHKKNYKEANINIIVMGNGIAENKLKRHTEYAQLVSGAKRKNIFHSFPQNEFKWLNVADKVGMSVYFYRKRKKLNKSQYIKENILDEICFSLFETVVSEMYEGTKASLNKIIFSSSDEFIGIHLKNCCISNKIELKRVLHQIVERVDASHIRAFFLKFKKEYNDSCRFGYKINLIDETKRCIRNLIYDGFMLGNKEIIKMVNLELELIKINEITSRFNRMINNDADFYLYKVIDCNRNK